MGRFYDDEAPTQETRHEIVLDAGKLIFVCLIVVLLSGSVFMAGYILGKMQAGSVAAPGETNPVSTLNDAGSADPSTQPESADGLTLAAAPAAEILGDDASPTETQSSAPAEDPSAPIPSDSAAQ